MVLANSLWCSIYVLQDFCSCELPLHRFQDVKYQFCSIITYSVFRGLQVYNYLCFVLSEMRYRFLHFGLEFLVCTDITEKNVVNLVAN